MTVPAIADSVAGNRSRNSGALIYYFCKHTIRLLRERYTNAFVDKGGSR